jgi:hypothetical protein
MYCLFMILDHYCGTPVVLSYKNLGALSVGVRWPEREAG